ncbi:MAG: CBS domain-containing protein [Reyranella sp.]|nr:CBS domain-containing protein [Reyranella sp.]
MQASDVMVSPVITVTPGTTVKELAKLLVDRGLSAVPVVDDKGHLAGIVSEGDLLHRAEIGTYRQAPSGGLAPRIDMAAGAAGFIKAHAIKVADVMTRKVVTAAPDTQVQDIAVMMETNGVKRIPILRNGQLVGIVSRANLVQAVATSGVKLEIPVSDALIRERLMKQLKSESWAHTTLLNATVSGGVVTLWGLTSSPLERQAIRTAAESMSGVVAVKDHIGIAPVRPA